MLCKKNFTMQSTSPEKKLTNEKRIAIYQELLETSSNENLKDGSVKQRSEKF